jgi:hypothetical protein
VSVLAQEKSSRRKYLKYAGAIVAVGAVAGYPSFFPGGKITRSGVVI